jgi:glycosyltransferase involved in cell wall biosynthesis
VTTVSKLFMTADAVGGVWTYALDLAAGLSALGVRTELAIVGPAPSPAQIDQAGVVPGLTLLRTGLPLDWATDDRRAVEGSGELLADMAADLGADVVQVNSAPLAATGDFRAPVVVVAHSCVATWWAAVKGGPTPSDFRWRTDLTRRAYAGADAVVAPSAAFAEATRRTYGLAERPRAVWNGRSPSLRPSSDGPGERMVLTAGRLWDAGKGVDVLDAAAARIDAPVVAAGPLDTPHGGRARFERLSLPGALSADRLAQLLSRRPVFASPSRYEPFGLSVLEAAQAGCPLILSDIPTFRELWDGAAVFVPAGDPDALAAPVNRLLADDAERERLGRAARERSRRYTVAAMAQAQFAVFEALCSSARPREGGDPDSGHVTPKRAEAA